LFRIQEAMACLTSSIVRLNLPAIIRMTSSLPGLNADSENISKAVLISFSCVSFLTSASHSAAFVSAILKMALRSWLDSSRLSGAGKAQKKD